MINLIGYILTQKYYNIVEVVAQMNANIFSVRCNFVEAALWHYILWEKVIFESKLFLKQMGRKEREANVSNNIPLKILSLLCVPSSHYNE